MKGWQILEMYVNLCLFMNSWVMKGESRGLSGMKNPGFFWQSIKMVQLTSNPYNHKGCLSISPNMTYKSAHWIIASTSSRQNLHYTIIIKLSFLYDGLSEYSIRIGSKVCIKTVSSLVPISLIIIFYNESSQYNFV